MTHIVLVVALRPAVDVVKGEHQRLLSRLLVNQRALLHVKMHQLVAPPCQLHVLGTQIVIVGTTEVEVFKREESLLGTHGDG